MHRRIDGFKRVATSRTNGYDKSKHTIHTNEHYNNGRGVRLMVVSEFDGCIERIKSQHKATDHKDRVKDKLSRHRVHVPSMIV